MMNNLYVKTLKNSLQRVAIILTNENERSIRIAKVRQVELVPLSYDISNQPGFYIEIDENLFRLHFEIENITSNIKAWMLHFRYCLYASYCFKIGMIREDDLIIIDVKNDDPDFFSWCQFDTDEEKQMIFFDGIWISGKYIKLLKQYEVKNITV